MYAQVIDDTKMHTLASASTVQKPVSEEVDYTSGPTIVSSCRAGQILAGSFLVLAWVGFSYLKVVDFLLMFLARFILKHKYTMPTLKLDLLNEENLSTYPFHEAKNLCLVLLVRYRYDYLKHNYWYLILLFLHGKSSHHASNLIFFIIITLLL